MKNKENKKDIKTHSIKNYFKDKRKRYKAISTVTVVFAIIIAVLINIGASALDNKFGLSLDLTKNKFFRLTDSSINYIKNIDKDIEIIVLSNEENFTAAGDYFIQANSVIKDYSKNSDKITVRYVDLNENPAFSDNFPGERLDDNSIIVKSGDKYKIIPVQNLFNVQTYYNRSIIAASEAEQAMTSAIMYVLSDSLTKISIISGYDELEASVFTSLLNKNNYDTTTVDILTEDIPSDSSMVMILSPTRDYDSEGISKIEKFLNNDGNFGKNLFVVLNPQKYETNNLTNFLESWNVKVKDGIVFDTDTKNLLSLGNSYFAPNFVAKHEYVDDEFTEDLANTNIPVTLPYSKPLDILDNTNVKTLLQSSKTSGIRPSSADENWTPGENDISGPIPSMVISSKNNDSGAKSTVTIVASELALSDQILSRTSLNNSAYFINAINKITNREDVGITIESKTVDSKELSITSFQATTLGIIFTIAIPLLLFITGLIVFIRRRNL